MAMNFCRPINVSDLVNVSGLSRRGFHKAFLMHTGLCPGEALRNLRVERAKRLLITQDLNVVDIAFRCGYRSANSFWVSFRQSTGVAPGAFQQQAGLRGGQEEGEWRADHSAGL